MIYVLSGLLASSLHVLAGPDHLTAVAPLAINNRTKAWQIGFMWGLGHTLGVIIVGLLFLWFKELIPIDLISAYSEIFVGVLLIMIGLWVFYRYHHSSHEHVPARPAASLGIGLLHGLAGVSHLLGIFPTLALPGHEEAIAYIAGFSGGTVLTMLIFTIFIGRIANYFAQQNNHRLIHILQSVGGSAAIVVGLFWIGKAL